MARGPGKPARRPHRPGSRLGGRGAGGQGEREGGGNARRGGRAGGTGDQRPRGSAGPAPERGSASTASGRGGLAPRPVSVDTLIYGRNPVREALRGRREVKVLWVVQGRPGEALSEELRFAAEEAGRRLPPVRKATLEELDHRAGSFEHQGVVAEAVPYPYADAEAILAEHSLIVTLDRIQDPHNLGAVVRTADAAGAAVVIPRHRAAAVTPAAVKASAGASEHVDVAQVRNLTDFLGEAKERGFWTYGAVAGAADAYTSQDYSRPTVFVLGSEGEGLSHRLAQTLDVLVSVPLLGRVDSLNVSVTAGVLLFEALRQREANSQTGGRG